MHHRLAVYNTLTGQKEIFQPLHPPHAGMYVCGPTVYGDAHLGHARPYVTFDIVFRYLSHLGYKVRYVRNITDVGHLENDADEGEDKIARRARLEQIEPMEVVQHYTCRYHRNMEQLNTLPPSIEPAASGHIPEQIKMIERIIRNGFAYEADGSVYFDVEKYNRDLHYGKLSGRVLEDLMITTRKLEGTSGKRNPLDFALWKKASTEHIMRWDSPWGEGFPGWHLECSAMSTKYLGEHFDIHGGGMDLLFPHHECEIAQSQGACGKDPVKYWLHNNMVTINGQKMGKSLGNFITLNEIFEGSNKLLSQPFSPMAVRFFILQAHYRSTLDFSNEALAAAGKGLTRLMEGYYTLRNLAAGERTSASFDPSSLRKHCYDAMNDDFNTPVVIAGLFEALRFINGVKSGSESITSADLDLLKSIFDLFLVQLLGMRPEDPARQDDGLVSKIMDKVLEIRRTAREKKDFATSDLIRDKMSEIHISIRDGKEGTTWSYEA